jgi:hypothetical protein
MPVVIDIKTCKTVQRTAHSQSTGDLVKEQMPVTRTTFDGINSVTTSETAVVPLQELPLFSINAASMPLSFRVSKMKTGHLTYETTTVFHWIPSTHSFVSPFFVPQYLTLPNRPRRSPCSSPPHTCPSSNSTGTSSP